jgi:hypothetical protein
MAHDMTDIVRAITRGREAGRDSVSGVPVF